MAGVLAGLLAVGGCGPDATPGGAAAAPRGTSSAPVSAPPGVPSTAPARPSGTAPAHRPATARPARPARPAVLRPGENGSAVRALQQRLLRLGYWLPGADGEFGDGTAHAVVALQKAAGLARDGVVGPRTRAALERGAVPHARSHRGHVIEVDKARQLVLVVDGGTVSRVLDASTGSGLAYTYHGESGVALTPSGAFRIGRAIDGMRVSKLGQLWRPRYFNGGIAIHGNPSVPPYPASHGCVRVTNAAIDMIWAKGLAPIGTRVIVY